MSILIFIIVLLVLVTVHEFGHFIVAKKFGIKVDEFGFGFPPRAAVLGKIGETLYTVNWIPFGGFVKIFGENPDAESMTGPDSSRSMVNKPKVVQAAVLFAGIFFNIVFAWILISVGYMTGLPTSVSEAPKNATITNQVLMITEILPNSPALAAGLQSQDIITNISADGDTIGMLTPESLHDFIIAHGDSDIAITYERDKVEATTSARPVAGIIGTDKGIGIAMDAIGIIRLPFFSAIGNGAKTTVYLLVNTLKGFGMLISGAFNGTGNLDQVSGPVGIVKIVGVAYNFGFAYLLSFTALISINLAIINLMPFPALDGGRLLFILIESIKGSRINPKAANIINFAGFIILIGLMLLVTVHDVIKLF